MTAREELPVQYVHAKEDHDDYKCFTEGETQFHDNLTTIKEEPIATITDFSRFRNTENGKFECPLCNLSLIDMQHLEIHLKECRIKNERKYLNVLSMSVNLKSPSANKWRQEKYQELFGYLDKFKELYLRPPHVAREAKAAQIQKLRQVTKQQGPAQGSGEMQSPVVPTIRSGGGCVKRDRNVGSSTSAIKKPERQKIMVSLPLTDSIRKVLNGSKPTITKQNIRTKFKEIFGDSDTSDDEDATT